MLNAWRGLSNKGKTFAIGMACVVIGILFYLPFTRSLILWILPLGSGIDDLCFFGFVLFGLFMLVFGFITNKIKI